MHMRLFRVLLFASIAAMTGSGCSGQVDDRITVITIPLGKKGSERLTVP